MSAIILDGVKIAADIKSEVAEEVRELTAEGLRPGLAVVLAGHNPASEIYVRNKVKTCEQLGIYSEKHTPPDSVTTEELLALVDDLNRRDEIDGILVQLPLPAQVDAKKVLLAVSPAKDVDGFHPMNVGYLSTQRPGTGAVYAGGNHRDSEAQQHSHRRGRSRGGRPQRHCGQAHRDAAAERQRDGDGVPL